MKSLKKNLSFIHLKAFLMLLFLASFIFSSCRKDNEPIQPEYGVKAVSFKNIDK